MTPSKILIVCFASFILLGLNDAFPAPQDDGGKHVHRKHVHHHKEGGDGGDGDGKVHVHHHHIKGDGGDGDGKVHVHHHHIKGSGGGGDGDVHVHHHHIGGGSPHIHHHSISGSGGGGGGAGGDTDINISGGGGGAAAAPGGGDVNINAGGGGGANLDPQVLKRIKDLLGKLNIDISQIDLSELNGLDLTHKFDGKDSLQPSMCHDKHNDRYGVGKHFVRGTRDVGFAIVSTAQDIVGAVLPPVAQGVGGGLKALLCAIEDGFSDFGGDFDSATDIAKHGLVNFFRLQGPDPILGIPLGIAGIAGEAAKAAGSIAYDAVSGVENAVGQLAGGLGL